MLFIFKYNIEIYSLHSLSPLRRQVIMESTDSLVSQASSLPPKIVENPDYLPPALPPKRHRTNIKLNNLNITPPSSPKFMVSESIESPAASTNDLSSQNNNNSLIGNNNRNMMSTKLEQRPPPTSPSSNYVQISTSTINAAAAAAAETAKQSNGEPTVQPPRAAVVVIPAATATATKAAAPQPPPPTSPSAPISNKTPIVNNVTDVKCSAVNNDVRVIYTNVNNLFTNTTNNRSADNAQHYMQMYDGCANDRSKSNVFATKIDCDDTNSAITANKENDRCPVQKNSSQTINNNNNKNKNNSNHSINNDKNVDDEEDIVVLRRPQASSNSSLKVLISLNPFNNNFFMLLENILTFGLIYRNLVLRTQNHMLSCVISMRTKIFN